MSRAGQASTVCRDFRRAFGSRRDILRAGSLSLTGLSLDRLFASRALARPSETPQLTGFGRARACILIFMWGGPSHLDTWDPKPEAPDGIRGPFKAIETAVPGIRVSEHFPRLATRADHLAIIRSMSHDDPAHLSTAHRVLTGHIAPTPKSDAAGASPRDWPHLGSILARVRPRGGSIPQAVTMPWAVSHPAAPGGQAPGQDAGWLGSAYDPMRIVGDPNAPDFRVAGLDLPESVSLERLDRRKTLIQTMGETPLEATATPWDGFRDRAIDALGSAEARGAFRIDQESTRLRDAYGRHPHGQCLLLARRLIESGVELVSVNWPDDGKYFWDTHGDNFNALKTRLMPPADQGFAALLDDLEARGMLDETLVVWVGEFGRAPKITAANAGREHWPRCYTAVLAGGGVQGGIIHGASDRIGAYPALDPVSPEDLGATILHALGISPETMVTDALGRPLKINEGQPVSALFG